jgi:hypothetical protein
MPDVFLICHSGHTLGKTLQNQERTMSECNHLPRERAAVIGHTGGLTLLLAVIGLAASAAAGAACTDVRLPFQSGAASPGSSAPRLGAAHFVDALYRPDARAPARLIAVDEGDDDNSIVGLWTFEWRAKGDAPMFPDGTLLDFGLIQWHRDGTEITNSGGRTPAVGDVCMGSWRQVGDSTYKLTHLALGYGPPPGPVTGYQGLAVLSMTVTVAPDGNSYHGNFTLTQYHLKFNPAVPESEFDQSAIDYKLTGTVTARRVYAD